MIRVPWHIETTSHTHTHTHTHTQRTYDLHAQVEVRQRDTGALAHRDNLSGPISAVLTGDYRGDGRQELIVCGQQGEVGMLFFMIQL